MKILTPLEAVLLSAEKNLNPDEYFLIQKELLNAFAEGYTAGDKRSTGPEVKKAILNSDLWATLNNPKLMRLFK